MSPPHPNRERLKELMAQYDLQPKDVALLLTRSTQTVYEWLCVNDNNINDNNLELLELKLAARSNGSVAHAS